MGMWDNVKNVIFGSAYDDDDYEDADNSNPASEEDKTPRSSERAFEKNTKLDDTSDYKRSNKVVNLHTMTKLSVVLVKPERYEEVAEIANHLRERRTVVLNLEKSNREIARRILDFLSGVAYAIDGNLKMVASNTYIITPYNVDIQGDLMDELETNGLYL